MHQLKKRRRSFLTDLDTADNLVGVDELNDNFVRFWLLVQRNYSNYGADERVQFDLSLLAHLCLFLLHVRIFVTQWVKFVSFWLKAAFEKERKKEQKVFFFEIFPDQEL